MARAIGIDIPKNASREVSDALRAAERFVLDLLKRPVEFPSYTIAGGLPNPADWPNCGIKIPDETGGSTIAVSNGTNWLRVSDGAVAS